jgi:hypothetical protein
MSLTNPSAPSGLPVTAHQARNACTQAAEKASQDGSTRRPSKRLHRSPRCGQSYEWHNMLADSQALIMRWQDTAPSPFRIAVQGSLLSIEVNMTLPDQYSFADRLCLTHRSACLTSGVRHRESKAWAKDSCRVPRMVRRCCCRLCPKTFNSLAHRSQCQ